MLNAQSVQNDDTLANKAVESVKTVWHTLEECSAAKWKSKYNRTLGLGCHQRNLAVIQNKKEES